VSRTFLIASLIGFMSQRTFPQSQPAPLAFERASVKPSPSGSPMSGVRTQGESLTGKNVTLKELMAYGYDLPRYQISGPDWIATEGYDVDATAKGSGAEEFRLMLRLLLEDRFKLRTHHETREIPAYWLVVASGGPRLRDPKEEESFNSALAGKSPFRPGFAGLFTNKSLPEFAERLGRPMDRPVVDKTGIKGRFWFQLEWAVQQTGQERYLQAGPALLAALREQAGLSLDDGTATVEVLVIDRAEKPSGN
jgi:uncharacterized protein (TIGR03435 family)